MHSAKQNLAENLAELPVLTVQKVTSRPGTGKKKEKEQGRGRGRGTARRATEEPRFRSPDTCSLVFFHSQSKELLTSPESRVSLDHTALELRR